MQPAGYGPGPGGGLMPNFNLSSKPIYLQNNVYYQQQPSGILNPQTQQQQILNNGLLFQNPSTFVPNTMHYFTPQMPSQNAYPQKGSSSYAESYMCTDSEEEISPTENPWQDVRRKRKRMTKPLSKPTQPNLNQSTTPVDPASQSNRFSVLSKENPKEDPKEENQMKVGTTTTENTLKAPPIFIQGVANYPEMIKWINTVIKQEDYIPKAMHDNVVKINEKSTDNFRKLSKHLQDNKIIHHTYQIKQDRAYRVVTRHLHPTIPVKEIREELHQKGFQTRNIYNIKRKTDKNPLSLFFVDLEPADNNKLIYDLKYLLNMSIKVEAPHKRNDIVQCTRCQSYNHTKAYCYRPHACVKCGGAHNSATCKKTRETAATCALCGGDHPANYKGCRVYQDLQKKNRPNSNPSMPNRNHSTPIYQNAAYAQTLKTNLDQTTAQTSTEVILTKFLDEFKNLFSQLLQQNSMVLNMLTTVINKINS